MEFNIKRLGLLLRKDLFDIVLKSLGIVGLIFFVITTFNLVIANFIADNGPRHYDIYATWISVFLISCAVIGSISYEEVAKRPTRIEYLNLPASTLEKTGSKFISAGIIFPIMMIIMYYIMYAYASGFNAIAGNDLVINNQPDVHQHIIWVVGAIIVSFFAYGSIKYNNASFPKIIIWGLAMLVAFGIIMFLYGLIMFPELRAEIFGNGEMNNQLHNNNQDPNIEELFIVRLVTKLFYIVPLIFWTFSFFTLKEKEA